MIIKALADGSKCPFSYLYKKTCPEERKERLYKEDNDQKQACACYIFRQFSLIPHVDHVAEELGEHKARTRRNEQEEESENEHSGIRFQEPVKLQNFLQSAALAFLAAP